MLSAIASTWALLLGVGLLMLGNGLQGTLLGVRASVENFNTTATGLVMTCFFIGFLLGSVFTPKAVRNVGHVRVFAALAALASAAVLLHAVFVTPWSWAAVRISTGFCFSGLYVIAESWLNDRATNETRGAILSVYMLITLGGMICGQLLINIGDPQSFELFVVVSVLVSVAVVPLALTATPAPEFQLPASVSIHQLYDASPLGVVGMVGQGVANGAMLSLLAVYGQAAGFSISQTAWFASAPLIGGLVLQWPVGRLSDHLDRRIVLTATAFIAGAAGLAAYSLADSPMLALAIAIGLVGGMTLPQYALCIAHTNDHLMPAQMVAASSTLLLVNGIGLAIGPTVAAMFMDYYSNDSLFLVLAVSEFMVGVFAAYRMTRRAAVPLDEQGQFVAMSPRLSPVATQAAVQVSQEYPATEENPTETH